MTEAYHYPHELFELVVNTVPRVCKSKKTVLTFFRGAGVPEQLYNDLALKLATSPDSIGKFEIARTVLGRLNDNGDVGLRPRREILKRLTEMDDFSTCWESDRLPAQGLIAQIRDVVKKKDTFTRIDNEREEEKKKLRVQSENQRLAQLQRLNQRDLIKEELYAQFSNKNAQARGKSLERILNNYFEFEGIAIREAFTLTLPTSNEVAEQIDGVIEFENHLYLVEMKWLQKAVGTQEIARHYVNLFSRDEVRGLFISAGGYTPPAIQSVKDLLSKKATVLCTLQEIVMALENEIDFRGVLKRKVNAALIDKNPFLETIVA